MTLMHGSTDEMSALERSVFNQDKGEKVFTSKQIKMGLTLMNMMLSFQMMGGSGLNLDQAFARLKDQNPTIQAALHRINGAQAQIAAARSAYQPHWTLRSSYFASDNPIQVFGAILNQSAFTPGLDFNDVPTVDNLNLQSMLTYPLFTGGQRKADLESARSQKKASQWTMKAVERHLQLKVFEVMMEIKQAESMLNTAKKSVLSMESNLKLSTSRRDAGTALEQEVLDVQVKLSDARLAELQAKNRIELTVASLRMLLAWPADQTLELAEEVEQITIPQEVSTGHRPELFAARAQSNVAREQFRASKADGRPRVQLFGSYDANHGWRTGESLGSWTAGIAMEWSLWSGGLNKAKTDKAHANLLATQSQEEAMQWQFEFEIRKARLELTEAQLRTEMASETVLLAEESLRLNRTRYEQGLGMATQLLDAETAFTKAQMDLTHAQTETAQATARLRHALGLPLLEIDHEESDFQ